MAAGRREFIEILILGGAGLAAFGCGDDGYDPDPGGGGGGGGGGTPSCADHGGTAASISSNHGHQLAIPVADFSDGMDHTYSITGSSAHDHTIALTAAQLATVFAGGTVDVVSTEATEPTTHSHTVRAACASTGGATGGGDYEPY